MFSKKNFFILSASLFILLAFSAKAHAADFYIDPLSGNDANDGHTSITAKKNIANTLQGIAGQANVPKPVAGDTIYLMDTADYTAGAYMRSNKSINSGTQGSPITIKNAPGATPTFRGCGLDGVYFEHSLDWYVYDGLTFEASPAGCNITIPITVYGHHNVFRNLKMHGPFSLAGLRLDKADYNTIEGVEGINTGNAAGGMGGGDFITLRGSKYNIIQNNIIKSSGHAAIQLLAYPPANSILSEDNQILNNIIDQKYSVEENLIGGGGGIYIGILGGSNLVEGNKISNIGQMPGLTQPKGGIDISTPRNIIRNNRVESYKGRGIYLSSYWSFNNFKVEGNLFEGNFVGPGSGLPLYIREGEGFRNFGINVVNNIFKDNTLTVANEPLVFGVNDNGSLIGMYTPNGRYVIYMGTYADGDWAAFANGNIFVNTTIVDTFSDAVIGYYYETGGFAKTLAQLKTEKPTVFYDANSPFLITATRSIFSDQLTPTPSFYFNSPLAGAITYGGDCTSQVAIATVGENIVQLNPLANGKYSNCTLFVTDSQGKKSNTLSLGYVIPADPNNVGRGAVATGAARFSDNNLVSAINNGDRSDWNFWMDNTPNDFTNDWVQLDFAGLKYIQEVDVFSVLDNSSKANPTIGQTFTQFGLVDFEVEYWDGTSWILVPNGSVTNNNLVWKKIQFAPLTTDKIRIRINDVPVAINPENNQPYPKYSRVVEVEVYTAVDSLAPSAPTGLAVL